jgi:hypothetical protein
MNKPEPIHFKADIERVVSNYTSMGVLDKKQAEVITGLINGLFPKAPIQREGKIIYFPGTVPKEQAP